MVVAVMEMTLKAFIIGFVESVVFDWLYSYAERDGNGVLASWMRSILFSNIRETIVGLILTVAYLSLLYET